MTSTKVTYRLVSLVFIAVFKSDRSFSNRGVAEGVVLAAAAVVYEHRRHRRMGCRCDLTADIVSMLCFRDCQLIRHNGEAGDQT